MTVIVNGKLIIKPGVYVCIDLDATLTIGLNAEIILNPMAQNIPSLLSTYMSVRSYVAPTNCINLCAPTLTACGQNLTVGNSIATSHFWMTEEVINAHATMILGSIQFTGPGSDPTFYADYQEGDYLYVTTSADPNRSGIYKISHTDLLSGSNIRYFIVEGFSSPEIAMNGDYEDVTFRLAKKVPGTTYTPPRPGQYWVSNGCGMAGPVNVDMVVKALPNTCGKKRHEIVAPQSGIIYTWYRGPIEANSADHLDGNTQIVCNGCFEGSGVPGDLLLIDGKEHVIFQRLSIDQVSIAGEILLQAPSNVFNFSLREPSWANATQVDLSLAGDYWVSKEGASYSECYKFGFLPEACGLAFPGYNISKFASIADDLGKYDFGTGNFTVEMKFSTEQPLPTTDQYLLSNQNPSNQFDNNQEGYSIWYNNNQVFFQIQGRVLASNPAIVALEQTTCYHIACVRTGTTDRIGRIYINGILVAEDNSMSGNATYDTYHFSAANSVDDDRVVVGGRLTYDQNDNRNVDNYFQGREINALRFWNLARTEAQINSQRNLILAPYNAEPGDQQGLLGYYRFYDGVNELPYLNQSLMNQLGGNPIILGANDFPIGSNDDPMLIKTVCSGRNPNARFAFEASNPPSVSSASKQTLVCQPNPFSHTLFVQFSSPVTGFFNLKLRDLNGKLVHEEKMLPVNDKVELTGMPTNLPKGMYVIEAIQAGKVIRNKMAHQ